MAIRRVLVAGASGGTGRELVAGLLEAGVSVQALTGSERDIPELADAGVSEIVVGDLLDPDAAERAVEGVDAVCCAVGASAGRKLLFGDVVDGEGVCNLVEAATAAGVERFVLESSIGVGDSAPRLTRVLRLLSRRVLSAKEAGEDCLRASGLEWTIVRTGVLRDGPATGEVVVGEGGDTVAGTLTHGDAARVMLDALVTPASVGRTFEVVGDDGLQGEASGVVDLEWNHLRKA